METKLKVFYTIKIRQSTTHKKNIWWKVQGVSFTFIHFNFKKFHLLG